MLGDTIELVNTVVGTLAGIVCKLLSDPKGSAGNDVKLAVALVKLVLIGVANVLTKDGTGKGNVPCPPCAVLASVVIVLAVVASARTTSWTIAPLAIARRPVDRLALLLSQE